MKNEIREFRIINEYGCVVYIYGTSLEDALDNYEAGLEFDDIIEKSLITR